MGTEDNVVPCRPAPIPVVVANPKRWDWTRLKRCFCQREEFILVEGCAAAGELLEQSRRLAPCVLIADPEFLSHFDPAEFASLVDFGRSVRVLVRGAPREDQAVQDLVRTGCMGFVAEDVSPAVLKRAVLALSRGEMWIERRLLTRVLQQFLFAKRSPKLTPREQEILRLIALGYKNRAIAENLSISHETVRWHIRGLHAKLGLQDRLHTALFAQQYLESEAVPARIEVAAERLAPTRASGTG